MNKLPLIFLMVLAHLSLAQPLKLTTATAAPADSVSVEEHLVEVALKNYANYEIAQREVLQSRKELTVARLRWTSNLRLFYNFNDQVIENATNYNLPIYGLGLGVNIGDVLTLPAHTKIAKQEVKIAQASLEKERLNIRLDVLKRYYNYLLAVELLKVRIQSYEDANSSYQIISRQFKEGKANLGQVDDAGRLMYKTMEEKLTMETQVQIAKLTLEEILTMTLEEALATAPGTPFKK